MAKTLPLIDTSFKALTVVNFFCTIRESYQNKTNFCFHFFYFTISVLMEHFFPIYQIKDFQIKFGFSNFCNPGKWAL
jgi:hypothetical protein